MSDEQKNDHEVGYGKPPVHSRFKKGQSGNPKGKPKGRTQITSLFKKVMHENIRITENGVSKKIPKIEAALMRTMNDAIKGDTSAMRLLLSIAEKMDVLKEEKLPAVFTLNLGDPEMIERNTKANAAYKARQREET